MNVNLVGVGAGYSYVVSGPTHQCYEDLTAMRALPNLRVYSPADHVCAAALFDRCRQAGGPKYLRFDAQVLPALYAEAAPDFKHGRLAPPEDPQALARVIVEQWENFDRAFHMSRAARSRVKQEFSITAVARKHLALFENILEQRRI